MTTLQAPSHLPATSRIPAMQDARRKSATLSTGPSFGYTQLVGQRRAPSRDPSPASARRLSYNQYSDTGTANPKVPSISSPSSIKETSSQSKRVPDALKAGDHFYEVAPGRNLAYSVYGSTATNAAHVIHTCGMWQGRKAGLYYGCTPAKMNVRLIVVSRAGVSPSDKNPLTEGRAGACAVKAYAKDISGLIRLHLKLREYWLMSYSGGACFTLETAQYLFDKNGRTEEERQTLGLKGVCVIAGLPPLQMVRKTMPWLQQAGTTLLANYPDMMVKLLVGDKKKAEREGALPTLKISADTEDDIIPTDSSGAQNASDAVSPSNTSQATNAGRVTKRPAGPKKKGVIGQVMKAFGGDSQASQDFYNKQRNKLILRKVRKEVMPRKEGIIRDASNILSKWNRPPSEMSLGGRDFPVFLWYSTTDELIPLTVAREFAGSLRKARGCPTEYSTSGDAYGIFLQELSDTNHFKIQDSIKRID